MRQPKKGKIQINFMLLRKYIKCFLFLFFYFLSILFIYFSYSTFYLILQLKPLFQFFFNVFKAFTEYKYFSLISINNSKLLKTHF